jgi:hypothetical protein
MSNFVTGLVRRGAGLPQPVSIRPALGQAQMPASLPPAGPGQIPAQSPAVALSDYGRGLDDGPRDFSALTGPAARLPGPEPAPAPEPVNRWAAKPSATPQETFSLQPRSEPPRTTPPPTLQVRGEDRSSLRVLPPPSLTTTAAETGENLERHTPRLQEDTRSPIARPEPRTLPGAVSGTTPAHPLPRPESIAIARVQPAPAASASSGRGKTQDSRSIQVKIGKVEIRSSQPAPATRPNRPSRTSGFDDLRLARTYLDRGSR